MSFGHREVLTETAQEYNSSFHKLMKMFTISILISFIGTFVGVQFIPAALVMPLIIVEFAMLISAFFIRSRKKAIGYGFVYTFCFISGITIFPVIAAYAAAGAGGIILKAFVLTVAIFGGLTLYAYRSQRDFSFLGGFLMIGLITMVGFGIIQLFLGGFGGALGIGLSLGGVLLFSGFILYDVSRYKHGLTEEMIPLAVLSLYLNFINLFLFLLRLLGLSRD